MINNPILPGFHTDPCICRKGEDYYIACSTFEWMPAVTIYHSRDLKNWELLTHILTDKELNLKGVPSSKGIWAPCLTYCEKEDLFYLVYGVMNSMNARYFDIDNYLVKSRSIMGPWSTPVYLHSAGFDASLFHDDDGRKWLVSLEWETRAGYEQPGKICLVEYDSQNECILGLPRRIYGGGTDRGCLEAPHLTKHNGFYYLMCAEGGTGYAHCVTMARSSSIWGPYQPDPKNPILTSVPGEIRERNNPDHLKPQYYNPDVTLQKAGHGSYVELPEGEVYMVFHCSRPTVPELRCILGRETGIEKMKWTEDGWLRTVRDSNLVREQVEQPNLSETPLLHAPERDDFDEPVLRNCYYAPRIMPESFIDLRSRPGYLRIRGQESQTSLHKASILATRLTSCDATVTTRMEFDPEVYQHNAGLILYYDNMDYCYLRKYYSATLGGSALGLIRLENGMKIEYVDTRIAVEDCPIYLRLQICGKEYWYEWGYSEDAYTPIGPKFDLTMLSDEYCKYGEFTGTMVGLTCGDSLLHRHYADFDFFEYKAKHL